MISSPHMHFHDISFYDRMIEFNNEEALDIVQKIYKDELVTEIAHIDPYTCNLTVDGKTEEYSISAILMNYSTIFGKAFDAAYPQANH